MGRIHPICCSIGAGGEGNRIVPGNRETDRQRSDRVQPAEIEEEYTPAPPATFAPPSARAAAEGARPARGDAKPARVDAKPAPQKSLYDSLEQEMASLLGRPNNKP